MKLFTISVAATLFATFSFAQIPITTVVELDPTHPVAPNPPGNGNPDAPLSAPQPQLVPCTPTLNTLASTTWGFNIQALQFVSIQAIGTMAIAPGSRGNLSTSGTITATTNNTVIERLAPFTGSMDGLCLAGTNILAAGTMQISDGLSGTIMTWSYPITATIKLDRSIVYAVTATDTLNLRPYGTLNPSNSNGYAYNNNYYVVGSANQIVSPLACPVPANLVLESAFGYGVAIAPVTGIAPSNAGTQLVFKAGTGATGTVTGQMVANNNNGGPIANPEPTETGTYQVYPNCTGFSMTFPILIGGQIYGANFEGVFASGNYSTAYIIATNKGIESGTQIGLRLLNRLTAAPVLAPFPPVPTGR